MGVVADAESPEDPERTAFPEIDWPGGTRRWGGEAAHWKALSGFIRRHAGDGALARAALLAGDPEGARASIHGFKGGAGVVAAVELERVAWELDGLLGAEVWQIAERSGELTRRLNRLEGVLNRMAAAVAARESALTGEERVVSSRVEAAVRPGWINELVEGLRLGRIDGVEEGLRRLHADGVLDGAELARLLDGLESFELKPLMMALQRLTPEDGS